MGEVILPFIDEKRLLKAIKNRIHLMTDYDKKRNKLGCNYLFINSNSYMA